MNELQKLAEITMAKLTAKEITPEQAIAELIAHGVHADDAAEVVHQMTGGSDVVEIQEPRDKRPDES